MRRAGAVVNMINPLSEAMTVTLIIEASSGEEKATLALEVRAYDELSAGLVSVNLWVRHMWAKRGRWALLMDQAVAGIMAIYGHCRRRVLWVRVMFCR